MEANIGSFTCGSKPPGGVTAGVDFLQLAERKGLAGLDGERGER
jgi:hypothetical protein